MLKVADLREKTGHSEQGEGQQKRQHAKIQMVTSEKHQKDYGKTEGRLKNKAESIQRDLENL